jgi:hypothetical protein
LPGRKRNGKASKTQILTIKHIGDYMGHITTSNTTSVNARRKHIIKVAPMTRAVRMALAASLAALALGASGGAFAGSCNPPAAVMMPCSATSIDATPVADLTLVNAAVTPAGHGAFIMPLAISQSSAGDVVIDNAAPITEINPYSNATAIYGYSSGGGVDITNHATGVLYAYSVSGNATGIEGYAHGNVGIHNAGDTQATSVFGNAIGLYGYSMAGDVSIDNSAVVTATSYQGLADGIFASGANIDVSNTGSISASGYTWAAGIDAKGTGMTAVNNHGSIYAVSMGATHAYGIYATGDVVHAYNGVNGGGAIEAQGYYATGIEAKGSSSVTIINDGGIVAGSATRSAVAKGINASSNGPGGAISITNNGAISAIGAFGGTGIAATATGTGGSASVINNGSIYASQARNNGYGAYGIIVSADGNATIDNNLTGTITVNTPGKAAGASALSFAGTASVTNAGDINVSGFLGADGIVSFAQNGSAVAINTGTLEVKSGRTGHGLDVGGLTGATAQSSGAIAVDAMRAYGITANSGNGDVSVYNSGSIDATYTGHASGITAFGVLATSVHGKVAVENIGDISTSITGQSVGIFASSTYGDVDVSSSGLVSAYSNKSTAVGVFARATNGMATVDNSGKVYAASYKGNAFGVLARGANVDARNSGDITANGYAGATGIAALSYNGTTVTTTGGAITVYAVGRASGINAQSQGGNVTVDNASGIDANGVVLGAKGIQGAAHGNVDISNSGDIRAVSQFGDAIGIYGYSVAGDTSITSSSHITVAASNGLADGIFASGVNVGAINSGSIRVAGNKWAAGIDAKGTGMATVNSTGTIYAISNGTTHAYGIYGTGDAVDIHNSGSIEAQGYFATGIEAQGSSSAAIINDGAIIAGSATTTALGIGIKATSINPAGVITITNNGSVAGNGYYGGTGIAATASGTGGSASVINTGSVYASQHTKYGYGAYGIVASADGNATISNTATSSITVHSAGAASGATALAFAGDARVTNAGDIKVDSTSMLNFTASGIVAFSQNGASYAGNTGSVAAVAGYTAKAVDASGFTSATVVNSGILSANAKYAYGVFASAGTGNVSVTNAAAGLIEAYSNIGRGFGVFGIATQGDVMVANAGSVQVYGYGQSAGVFGVASAGNTSITNSGDITTISGGNVAVGVFGRAAKGTVSIQNSGHIIASDVGINGSSGTAAYGVLTRGAYATVTNSGSVVADGNNYATAIAARSDSGTMVSTSTSSVVQATAKLVATGIEGRSTLGNVSVANAGSVMVDGMYGAAGIQVYSGSGNAVTGNAGSILATSGKGIAIGETGYSLLGTTTVTNSGMINVTGTMGAYGLAAQAAALTALVTNSGHITVTSPDTAAGILASAYGDVTINNSGTVLAVAVGGIANVAAIQMGSQTGTATLNNSGKLSTNAPLEGQVAVRGSNGVEVINNTGHIYGALVLLGGDDRLNNNSGGVWDVNNHSTDFGGGDDTINNLAGGMIRLNGGAIHLGASVAGNAFNNAGTIKVMGDGLIDMGSGGTPFAPTLAPPLNPLPFINNGVIDMTNGVANDSLTILGDMGGKGALNIDVMVPSGPADSLYVKGSMVAGAVQTVNATFNPSLLLAAQSRAKVDFAFITGNSTAGSFVGGQVIGYNPSNFLDLSVVVTSKINTANTTNDVFSIGVDAVGLNDTGSLAASIATGAAGMLNAQVGTFKQRMGVNPYGDAGKVMSAFFRTYTSEGDVRPKHTMADFGQGGNFDYDQSVWGREFGVNANLFGNLHAGLVLGSAEGRQRLTGKGVGQNRMDGMTWGMYATWLVPQGFYVDVSGRWMAVDVRSTSVAGTLATRAHTGAWNVEAGYEWLFRGFSIVPQLQYTRTKVDGVAPILGSEATFASHGGTSSRGRVGVEISKTFESGGIRWTPYGSINAIREFDGNMTYTVANAFNGGTSIHGTSAMAELGLGVQKGSWGFTIGANWTDGGANKNTLSGQALVRLAW